MGKLNLPQLAILAVLFLPEDPDGWKKCRERDSLRRKKIASMTPEQFAFWNRKRLSTAEISRRVKLRNPERSRARALAWSRSAGHKAAKRRWRLKKTRECLYYRLEDTLRSRMRAAIRVVGGRKSYRSSELLGCTPVELQAHLVRQFRDNMTLENHGKVWHIDHKIPCAKFDLRIPEQQKECFHFSNLQPLFVHENLQKKDKCVR